MVSYDYSSDSSDEITEWKMQELRDEVYSIADGTPDGVNRDGKESYMCWDYSGNRKLCICGKHAPQYTCWWPGKNCGRRYYGCKNWCNRKRAYPYCTYFEWEDPPMDERSLEVINQFNDERLWLTKSQSSPAETVVEAPSPGKNRMIVCFTTFCLGICFGILAGVIVKIIH